jgi:IS30 family transposase
LRLLNEINLENTGRLDAYQRNANILKIRNRRKRKIQGELEDIILEYLLTYSCSPQQISGRLKKILPESIDFHVSHETIYRYIYNSEKRATIVASLRRRHKYRRKKRSTPMKRGGIKNKTSIHERPDSVEDREEFGHWEGDLIIGKGQKSAMLTLVERSSRYLMVFPIKKKDSKTVVNTMIDAFKEIPKHLRKSITYDQGTEMAEHERVSKALDMPVYFADAGKPQQRGSNENTNGLLRQYFPKGSDLLSFGKEVVEKVQNIINQRPRPVLNYSTAKEVLEESKKQPQATLSDCY